jgi:hypothetical protein
MGEWAIFTKAGVYAPTGRVWFDSKEEALKVCPFIKRRTIIVKHASLITSEEMRLIISKQLQQIKTLNRKVEV